MANQRPQDLVFSLYGEYLLDRGGLAWVGSLIELLAPFDLSENAVRTALSRMARKGWLSTRRRGRRSWYRLSAAGRRLLVAGRERIYHPPRDEAWDGSWYLVAYSIPEEQRKLRDRFRTALTWLGCGSLGGGLWVSPRDIRLQVGEAARELGVAGCVEVFQADHLGLSDSRDLVARAWDLAAVTDRYGAFLRRFDPVHRRIRNRSSPGELSDCEAFIHRFELIHEYRDFPLLDPYLPRELLPADWIGDRAARLFAEYHDVLAEPADRYVDTVLAAEREAVPA